MYEHKKYTLGSRLSSYNEFSNVTKFRRVIYMTHFKLSACAELRAILTLLGFTTQAAEDFISLLQRYTLTQKFCYEF